tara:strand:- start:31 stop:300 length:270 start_codon:yes stop_codon:yes gene_type:complete
MKTILDLLATKQSLIVTINGESTEHPLLDPIHLKIKDGYQLTLIDGFEIKDWQGYISDGDWYFDSKFPFYQWKHHATDQGWLFYQNTNY